MGTLKYAILGLLNRQEMTGYELTKAIEHSLLGAWRAKHSQIYPELKSLTQKGLVKYEVEISGTVLEKKVFHYRRRTQRFFALGIQKTSIAAKHQR